MLCRNPACGLDLLLHIRRSRCSASSTCSRSGCSVGWCCWRVNMMLLGTRRSWCSGIRLLSLRRQAACPKPDWADRALIAARAAARMPTAARIVIPGTQLARRIQGEQHDRRCRSAHFKRTGLKGCSSTERRIYCVKLVRVRSRA
jgi:hypothetical protein